MTEDAPVTPTAPRRTLPRWLTAGRLALGVSGVALGLAAAPHLTGRDFGGQVRDYLLTNPQVLDEVMAARQAAEDGARVEQVNIAIASNPALLEHDPRDPSIGPIEAKVVVHEFFDYRCPGCKAVSQDFMQIVLANPDVRFVFKEWPILDRGDDSTSQYAARAALAAQAQGRYLPVHQALMAEPSLSRESIDRILADNGVTLGQAAAAIASPATTRHIADIHTAAAGLQLTGTPTFIINGKATASIAPAEVAAAITSAKGG
ncbi:DsbA family protein [Brevundimonas variabilis]|uniref:Protein-disulfide isomerase n=1 Tax=Brevundimonas variabilis TaxID=74312 RepID=A0A7W9CHG0_9CAUL|nr:thioredoxin domain-containing protein [Brevundimonas variabilis]MBB5745458.1 protein-disulfide isomerase [Brevundimonas variabilis]